MVSLFFLCAVVSAAPLLSGSEGGFTDSGRSADYDILLDALFADEAVVSTVGDALWVPWYRSSSSSDVADLHAGANCATGLPIDELHNCMVTDEFSQVGLLVAMGDDQERMRQFFNTLPLIRSDTGFLPSWRVFRDGGAIEPCLDSINGNCDSASDADARIIIALYVAANNPSFTDDSDKSDYASLATVMADDLLEFETVSECRQTSYGEVCHWLAGGVQVAKSGLSSTNFAYTGYYPDAIMAMLAAYKHTGDEKYLVAAEDFVLNYMLAAQFDGESFSAPPGMAFRWLDDMYGEPMAVCTNTCDPVMWDGFDASRALGMCQAQYYAVQMGVRLPQLEEYCAALTAEHMSDPLRAPLQFSPDGSAASSAQSGYFAQGLQSLHLSGAGHPDAFRTSLNAALSHFNPTTGTFDNEKSFGVYTKTFVVRALGMGLGRDLLAFVDSVDVALAEPVDKVIEPAVVDGASVALASVAASCQSGSVECIKTLDLTNGLCRTVKWDTAQGMVQLLSCVKDDGYAEVYRQVFPEGVDFAACIGDACVDDMRGFARFELPVVQEVQDEVPVLVENPVDVPVDVPVVVESPVVVETPLLQGVASLAISCEGAESCVVQRDVVEGLCRWVEWSTAVGDIKLLSCEKDDGIVEVYRQSFPAGADVRACVGNGCVDDMRGFARFSLADVQAVVDVPVEEVIKPVNEVTDPVVEDDPVVEVPVSDEPVVVETPLLQGVASLAASCQQGSSSCALRSDTTSGLCRTIEWSTAAGNVKLLACEKADGYAEVYRQELPAGADVRACVGDDCVDDMRGFTSINY